MLICVLQMQNILYTLAILYIYISILYNKKCKFNSANLSRRPALQTLPGFYSMYLPVGCKKKVIHNFHLNEKTFNFHFGALILF